MKHRPPPKHLTAGFYEKGYTLHGRRCWLKQFDDHRRPCSERFHVIHLIKRQRIRKILEAELIACDLCDYGRIPSAICGDDESYECPACEGKGMPSAVRAELIELAEWDPRNCGGLACDGHHGRQDDQLTPPLRVPADALSIETIEFVDDWGLEVEAVRRFDNYDTAVLGAGVRPSGRSAPASAEQVGGRSA